VFRTGGSGGRCGTRCAFVGSLTMPGFAAPPIASSGFSSRKAASPAASSSAICRRPSPATRPRTAASCRRWCQLKTIRNWIDSASARRATSATNGRVDVMDASE